MQSPLWKRSIEVDHKLDGNKLALTNTNLVKELVTNFAYA